MVKIKREGEIKAALGLAPSTARSKLVKSIMFQLVVESGRNTCFRCQLPMDISTVSIEHKENWWLSENPVGIYFDLNNISFSHLTCNTLASRRRGGSFRKGKYTHGESGYRCGCRCDTCKRHYSAARKERYQRLGK